MPSLAQTVDLLTTGLIRNLLSFVGIYEPFGRGIFFGFLSVLFLFWFRPLVSFTEDGDPRPWTYYDDSPIATMMPWWVVAYSVFMVALLFI